AVGSGPPPRTAAVPPPVAGVGGTGGIAPAVTGQFRRGDVRHCTADITRARRLLGFAPRVGWEDGIAELVAWARDARAVDGFAQADRELRARRLATHPTPTPPPPTPSPPPPP